MEKHNELTTIAAGVSPAELIKDAIKGGANLENLEKLISLQERYTANEAKKYYHEAMAAFKTNPPKIDKDRTVAYGNTKYNHASLANVTEKIGSELSKHGLSASWTTKQNGSISVTCRITHVQGHSEETTLSAPSDASGSKNAIQAIGSTITYLERYTLLALTGLATYDQDDDGQATGPAVELITESQINALRNCFTELHISEKKFIEYMAIPKLEEMTKVMYLKALAAIDAKRKQKAGKK